MKANPFPPTGHIAAKPLDLIHMDVHGPVPVQSHSGVKYSIFVDDITLASKSQKALDETVKELAKHFPLRDLGPTSFLLGIHITRDFEKRTISLSQRQHIVDMLDRFGFGTCSP